MVTSLSVLFLFLVCMQAYAGLTPEHDTFIMARNSYPGAPPIDLSEIPSSCGDTCKTLGKNEDPCSGEALQALHDCLDCAAIAKDGDGSFDVARAQELADSFTNACKSGTTNLDSRRAKVKSKVGGGGGGGGGGSSGTIRSNHVFGGGTALILFPLLFIVFA